MILAEVGGHHTHTCPLIGSQSAALLVNWNLRSNYKRSGGAIWPLRRTRPWRLGWSPASNIFRYSYFVSKHLQHCRVSCIKYFDGHRSWNILNIELYQFWRTYFTTFIVWLSKCIFHFPFPLKLQLTVCKSSKDNLNSYFSIMCLVF